MSLLKRKLAGDAIPGHLTTLSVSWLNNQFKAIAVHRGVIEGSWERPGEADGAGNFENFIHEAVAQTGYHGQTVSLVLAHPRLVQQLVEVPPVKGAALQKIIQRQAQQQKVFAGEAAWASQSSPSGKGVQRIVLHLFPRLLLNQLIQGCKRNGLYLTAVLPPSAILHHQLTQLPLQKGEAALLAAETGGSTTLVIGHADGQILLARTLPGNWNQEAERLVVDLNRTILFANQQYGLAINEGIWLFGPGAAEQKPALQTQIQFPLKLSPVSYDPFYWATEALKLRAEASPNLIGVELQTAPQRRVFAKVVALSTSIIVALSLAASAYFVIQGRQEKKNLQVLASQSARMETKRNELQRLDSELSRKQQVIQLVIGDRPPPAPAWLLAYLAEAVPSDLVVTNLHVKREQDFWRIRLAGTVQQGLKQPGAPPVSRSVALLKSRLSSAPFHIKIPDSADNSDKPPGEKPPAGGSSLPAWLNRVASSLSGKGAQTRPEQQDQFNIEGIMR
jgi:hypothetical protein